MNQPPKIEIKIPGCGCLVLALAIVGFLYLIGALT